MSRQAESLVWERSRAGKSDLLMLVKIADLTDDDGRNCWAEIGHLAKACRASERGAQYILRRLVEVGEIEIDDNEEGRELVLRGGRRFRPKWFIHVRCVYAWEEYQTEAEDVAKIADFRRGRPKRKPAKIADSISIENRNNRHDNPQNHVEKSAKSRTAYKEGSLNDPLVEVQAGAAPLAPLLKPADEDPENNLGVITKLAHEAFDLLGPRADLGDVAEAVKSRCAKLRVCYAPGDVVRRAIDSARWQRQRRQPEVH